MLQRVVKYFSCAALVVALTQIPARAASFGFAASSNALGRCKQQECVAAFFVAESHQPQILIFNRDAKVIGTIAVPQPVSLLATDAQARVYIANDALSNVLVYSPPFYDKPTRIGVPSGKKAGGIAVDTRSGRFAIFSDVRFYGVEAQIYEPNSTTPCATVQAPAYGSFFGTGAFDREGALYAPIEATSGGVALVSIPGGCRAHTIQLLGFGQPYNLAPYHIEFDSNDDLAIENLYGGAGTEPYTVYTFHHPTNGQFGKPIAVTRFDPANAGIYYEYFDSFLGDGKHIWAGDNRNLSLYNYPAGGIPIFTLTGAAISDCYLAVVPPLQP